MTPADLVAAIHARAVPGVVAVTGGGASAIAELLAVPDASQTVLEAIVPYHTRDLIRFLGSEPSQFCSAETAGLMADRAYQLARRLSDHAGVWGLSATAGLASGRPKKGDHRFFAALRSAAGTRHYSLLLHKGARDRAGEEAVLMAALLNVLAEGMGISERVPMNLLEGEALAVESVGSALSSPWFIREIDGATRSGGTPPALLFPGSFRPLHAGHRQLAALASAKYGLPVTFEISRQNVDKPPLDDLEVARRLRQFAWYAPVAVTGAATFAEKARLFPGCRFIAGADTALRLVDPRYYWHDAAKRDEALDELLRGGHSFLIAGRAAEGEFINLSAIEMPPRFRGMFEGVNEGEFRMDVSSTALRQTEHR